MMNDEWPSVMSDITLGIPHTSFLILINAVAFLKK